MSAVGRTDALEAAAEHREHRIALCRPLHLRKGGPRLVGQGRLDGVDYRIEATVHPEGVSRRTFDVRFAPVGDPDPDLVLSSSLVHTPGVKPGVRHVYVGDLRGPASPKEYPLAAEVRTPPPLATPNDNARGVDRTYVRLVVGKARPRRASQLPLSPPAR